MQTERQLARGEARAGDWIEVDVAGGGLAHRGMILGVLGSAQHEHYRVRWDDEHETIFYPAAEARIIRAGDDD